MEWVCESCGYKLVRTGYTEICPQCWRPTMKGVANDERSETEKNPQSDQSCQ